MRSKNVAGVEGTRGDKKRDRASPVLIRELQREIYIENKAVFSAGYTYKGMLHSRHSSDATHKREEK